ncbi:MAG: prepilin-type N-terminal cleavage/methylation domain-containing protein [Patescibacteria group bacterium]
MNKRGFTLVELLVVMSIMMVLSSVILVSVQAARDKSRIAAGLRFEKHTQTAFADNILARYDFENIPCTGTLPQIPDTSRPNGLTLIPPGGTESDCAVLSTQTPTGEGRSYNMALNSIQYSFLSWDSGGIRATDKPFTKFSIGFWAKSAGFPITLLELHGDASGFTFSTDNPSNNGYLDVQGASTVQLGKLVLADDKWHYNLISIAGTKLNFYRDGVFVSSINVPGYSNAQNTGIDAVALLSEGAAVGKTFFLDNLVFIGEAI